MLIALIYTLILGAVSGWLASKIMKRDTGNLGKNIVLGIVGSIAGRLVFGLIGLSARGPVMGIVFAALGACLVILIADKITK